MSVYTSQRGEDQIVERIFKRIGTTTQWCVEFGATDGQRRSNTWYFINERGWSSVQIEPVRDYHLNLRTQVRDSFDALQQRYKNSARVICLNRWVASRGDNRLDTILRSTPIPHDFDLLSLDVDGAEYNIWESLHQYTPRLVIVEHNKTIPIEVSFHSDRGSSLRALTALGKQKGYELAAANDLNGIFVRQPEFGHLSIRDNAPETLWRDHARYRLSLAEQPDGTLALQGEDRVRWARGADGTLSGQIRTGHYQVVSLQQTSLPPVVLPQPRQYLSGWLRHFVYSLSR